ncbi:hypothetical protein [Marinimicrobium alkaliphilum]|uniref:hypothetical protein n=1 Tax=Marinimicrobium alkaliphilum TaxID=2202654 RepID=UPI001300446E|nr:hypothetical protein [Marinimicrobium alkaliphilum]
MSRVMMFFLITALALPAWAESLRDPTRPLGGAPASFEQVDLSLHSILVSAQRRQAVINGQMLQERDEISGSGGVRIVRIERGAVTVQQGSRRWQLHLHEQPVRRTH